MRTILLVLRRSFTCAVSILLIPQLCAETILVQDDFIGAAGSAPNPAEFQTGGPTNLNGGGELNLNTLGGVTSWVKTVDSATPGASQTVVLQFRAYAYAESWNPGIYGNAQPRGLRLGSDANNVIEFYSAARNLIGIRTRANGAETTASYAVGNVYDWHNYEIIVTSGSAVFKVDGTTAATLTTNLPTGALNAYFTTSGPSNIPISLESLSFFIQSPSPSIGSFSPNTGPAGTSVTITGTNFTGATALRFGGVDAMSFTVDSASQITATVPTGALTGPITVVTPDGSASSSGAFPVTLPTVSNLSSLSTSAGTLTPSFDPETVAYTASVPHTTTSLTVTPTTTDPLATVAVNGVAVASGSASQPVSLAIGDTTVTVQVTAQDGIATRTYTLVVNRSTTLMASFANAGTIPVTAASYAATGCSVNLSLGFAPPVGTGLTIVKNTGLAFISGQFSNLAHGQTIALTFGSTTYRFVANYYGDSGNDLVLEWPYRQAVVWGYNLNGELGNGTTTNSSVPVGMNQTGVLAGKTVVAISGGSQHSLALCSDGILAAWGRNNYGQLGNGTTTDSNVPVAVNQSGVLAGKTVVAVSGGGEFYSLALCSDGSLAAWGFNFFGQLGDGTNTSSNVPVAVDQTGMLIGKTVVAIYAGGVHSLALCSDGTLAAWGLNNYGQLGNGTNTHSNVPVAVNQSGVLSGKTIVAVSGGYLHSLALCSDGTVAAWGDGTSGQLGDGTVSISNMPVAVNQSGVLAGKSVVGVFAGNSHSLALCTDGTLAAWGLTLAVSGPSYGQGNLVPVAVDQSGVLAGKAVVAISGGGLHCLVQNSDGTVAAWGDNNDGQLGDGTTTNSNVAVAVNQSGIFAGKQTLKIASGYSHSLALAAYAPSSALASLSSSTGTLSPAFSSDTLSYTASVPHTTTSITVTPTAADSSAIIEVNGIAVKSGSASQGIPLALGDNTITIKVTTEDSYSITDYTLVVNRSATLMASFANAGTIPVTAASYTATGCSVNLSLGFAPPVGTGLTVVKNTGLAFISGQFSNLTHGENVALTFGGTTYRFVANYYGGSGNDLVLEWPYRQAVAWGSGQLGDGTNSYSSVPVAVNQSGVLAGKTVVAISGGAYHSLALCSDGTLAAWGRNNYGQLGNGTTTDSNVPVAVNQSGVLAGKTVAAVSCGAYHSLALCSDGTLAAWGLNGNGQLGDGTTTSRSVPVTVNQNGVLAGKTVVAVSGSLSHSLALCSDGSIAAWGYGGLLGNGTFTDSNVPVAVNQSGVLAGKTVVAVSSGPFHNLALCSDGTLAAWGYNNSGQLGDGTTTSSNLPVSTNQSGVLAGKTVVSVSGAGHSNNSSHSLALCSDGTLTAWGLNNSGQLGDGTLTSNYVPVAVSKTGVLAGKTPLTTASGGYQSLALAAYAPSSALASLSLSEGTLSPAFSSGILSYSVSVPTTTSSITVTPTASTPGSTTTVNGQPVISGSASQAIALTQAPTVIEILVTAADNATRSYTLRVVSGMEAWKLGKFTTDELADPAISGDQATPANDGISNLMKYAFALEPMVCGTADLPDADKQDGYLTLTFRQNKKAGDITFTVQAGSALTKNDWQPATTEVARTDEGDHWLVSVRDKTPISSSPCRFMRLKISK